MLPYFVVFLVILINAYIIEQMKKKNNKLYIIFVLISIVILALFAGLRNDTVGYDIDAYIEIPYEWAKNMTLGEFINSSGLEIGFATLMYAVSIVAEDYHVFLVVIQFIITSCLYYYALKSKKNIVPIIFAYLMIFFNDTFSFMRESLSYLILLVSIVFLKEKKYKKLIIASIFALSFHYTAIVVLLIYAVYFVNNSKIKRTKQLYNMIVLSSFLIIALFYKQIVYGLCYYIKILPERYYLYFNSKYANTNNIPTIKLIFSFIILVYEYCLAKIKKDNNMTYVLFSVFSLMIIIISYKLEPMIRLSIYFTILTVLETIPDIHCIFRKNNFNRVVSNIIVTSLMVAYWIYIGCSSTVPYISDILNIK